MQFRMKSIDQCFTEYGESHRNATNKEIHWVCVTLITYTLLGLLWVLSPYALLVFSIVALVFYLTLSMVMSLVMLLAVILMAWSFTLFSREALLISCVVIFVLAWIGQFIGHKIEGPSKGGQPLVEGRPGRVEPHLIDADGLPGP